MTVSRSDVITLAPELSVVPAGTEFDFFIAMASTINDDQYAGALLTAHLMTVSRMAEQYDGESSANLGQGPVSSESVGEVSRSYGAGGSGLFAGASAGTILMGLNTTKYGIMYSMLAKLKGPGMRVL